mmetsp:Transcript_16593/g.49546  ORF Transcript_16593/g.49546 Transcript_16593/m.49546 type:complete len:516 (+) Transcript_16593:120-1667(+)
MVRRRAVAAAFCLAGVAGFSGLQRARAPRCAPARAAAVDIEKSETDSSVTFTVPVPGSLTKAAYKTAAGEFAQTETIPGWRQKDWKKVPASVVAGAVGAVKLKSKAIEKLSESETHSAIAGLDMEVIGQAQLVGDPEELVDGFTPGEDWNMRVKIDVWPEPTWSQPYDDGTLAVEVEREAKDMSVRDKAMEALRERYCDINPTAADYAAAEGDVAVVDMDGYLRDEAGGRAGALPLQGAVGGGDLELVLEPGKFLPGVVEAIIGAKAGDKITVPVDFPESKAYREEQPLAGVKAAFDVTVKEVKTRSIPELNDAFASKIRDGLTLAELQVEVENTVGAQEDDKTTEAVHKALEEALGQRMTSKLPSALVSESARQKFQVMLTDLRNGGTPDDQIKQMISPEGFEKYLKVVKPKCEAELRGRLAVEAIGREHGLEPDAESVDEQMELVRRQYEQQERDSGAAFNEEKAREKVSHELRRIKVLDHVMTVSKITYKDKAPVKKEDEVDFSKMTIVDSE